MLLIPASAWAYRPFVSTDAAVADPREVEVELGYFNLERSGHENTIATPSVVLNYGVAKRLELVGEFRLDVSPDVELIEPASSLKAVLRKRGAPRQARTEHRRRGWPAVTVHRPGRTRRRLRGTDQGCGPAAAVRHEVAGTPEG